MDSDFYNIKKLLIIKFNKLKPIALQKVIV